MENYRKMLKQALLNNASCNAIALSRGMSHNTVRRAKRLAEAAGLTPENVDGTSDTKLREILYPGKRNTNYRYPDCEVELAYLEKGYNLQEAHARYSEEVGMSAALGYSAYCDKLRKFRKGLAAEFRHIHQPGYAVQIDYGGKRPKGKENGVKRKFELFVGVLPASGYIFAVATRTQSTEDTIEASIQSLEYYNGVPETLVSDNLKAVVISRPRMGNPVINQRYLAFADYYGMRVTPTRVRKPKDKASVEVAVKLIQRVLNLRLQSRPNLELPEINSILRVLVDELNNRPMKRGGESRRQRFERLDLPELYPLPKERMTFIGRPQEKIVPASYHVPFDCVHYSVPCHLIGKLVTVRYSPKKIEILHDGQQVAIHERSYTRDAYITISSHRPENHRAYIDYRFNDWKTNLPPIIEEIVDNEIKKSNTSKDRLMQRVRRLVRTYSLDRLSNASLQAIQNKSPNLSHVTNLLLNNLDGKPVQTSGKVLKFTPTKNVRGGDYFDREFNSEGDTK